MKLNQTSNESIHSKYSSLNLPNEKDGKSQIPVVLSKSPLSLYPSLNKKAKSQSRYASNNKSVQYSKAISPNASILGFLPFGEVENANRKVLKSSICDFISHKNIRDVDKKSKLYLKNLYLGSFRNAEYSLLSQNVSVNYDKILNETSKVNPKSKIEVNLNRSNTSSKFGTLYDEPFMSG